MLSCILHNCDLFIYIKGDMSSLHPDEKHALKFKDLRIY